MTVLLRGFLFVFLLTFCAERTQQEISATNGFDQVRLSAELRADADYYGGQCTESDFQCSSCSQLSMSIGTSIGLINVDVECNTTIGEYCNKYLRRCSSRKSYCSLGGEFKCNQEGRFPHPFQCNLYYECTLYGNGSLAAAEYTCANGTSYNAKTYQCDGTEYDVVCWGYPVPECPDSPCLDINPLPQNPNIFYTCEDGVPQLYKCTEGEDFYYDPVLFQCVRNGSTTTTTTTTTEDPPTTEAPDNSTDPGESCLNNLAYVPYTCNWAYYCTQMPSPSWLFCGNSHYFDREKSTCVQGNCPYVNEGGAACSGISSGIFPIAGHCNSRYMCYNGDLNAVLRCTTSYYFDRDLLECVLGSCPYKDL